MEKKLKKIMKKMKRFKKICVITTSRADYGQLRNLTLLLKKEKTLKLQLIVAGSHFIKDKGYSVLEILKDKIPITYKIKIKTKNFQSKDVVDYTSENLKQFSNAFQRLKPDIIILLGDRYETLAAATSALIFNIPIAHLHGGEITAGVIDESLRHAITKMSDIHFTANSIFQNRVIRMGEDKKNVYSVGALTAENIKNLKMIKKDKIEKAFKFKFMKRNLIITVHPEKKLIQTKLLIDNLFLSLKKISKKTFLIFTAPNSDKNSDYIFRFIKNFVKKNKNSIFIPNLGYENYISCVSICDGIIGNSSSGITEAPILKKGSINIGLRQKGRPQAKSVLQVDVDHIKISKALTKIFSEEFKDSLKKQKEFYFKKNTKFKIIKILKEKRLENIKLKEFKD